MKALSILQPWASLIAIGAKTIETRNWRTDYRGRLAIHASAKFPRRNRDLCYTRPFDAALLKGMGFDPQQPGFWGALAIPMLPLGMVIATCELVDCVRFDVLDHKWREIFKKRLLASGGDGYAPEYHFGDYSPGRYGLILENIKPIEKPIPARGALGLWELKEAA